MRRDLSVTGDATENHFSTTGGGIPGPIGTRIPADRRERGGRRPKGKFGATAVREREKTETGSNRPHLTGDSARETRRNEKKQDQSTEKKRRGAGIRVKARKVPTDDPVR